MKRSNLLLAAAALALPATLGAQEEMAHEGHHDEVAAHIEAANDEFAEAFTAGDIDAMLSQYASNAVLLPPGAEPVEGQAGIREFFAAGHAEMTGFKLELTTKEVMVAGGHAMVSGGYVFTDAEGNHVDHGKYMDVWAETDDGWRIVRAMWNSSMSEHM